MRSNLPDFFFLFAMALFVIVSTVFLSGATTAGTSWTALVVDENQTACIVALGPGWVPGSQPLNPAAGDTP